MSFVVAKEEKDGFWNKLFHLMSCTPQNEMVVLAGDMTGQRQVGSSNVGYDGMHGGFRMELGIHMASGSCRQAKPSHLQHIVHEAGIQPGDMWLVLLKVRLTILLYDRGTKLRFVTLR